MPESDHTLRVLIEFRNEFREFKSQIEQRLVGIEERFESLGQTVLGITSGNQFMLAGIQGRFENLERRVALLEQSR